MIWDYCNCLFLKQFRRFNCFFKSHIALTVYIFCRVSLSDVFFPWNLGRNLQLSWKRTVYFNISRWETSCTPFVMSISNNIRNNKYVSHNEATIRSMNSEVASSQHYVRSLIESLPRAFSFKHHNLRILVSSSSCSWCEFYTKSSFSFSPHKVLKQRSHIE
jgi:hypothetical protein